MDLSSGDYLARLGLGNGHIVLTADGTCELKNADGSAMELVDRRGQKHGPELPRRLFNIYRNEGLIRQDRSAPAGSGLVFRLTKNGRERVTLPAR
jgi:hypothetical protein